MRRILQTKFGEDGNCMMASLASAADFPGDLEELPDLARLYHEGEDWWSVFVSTARELGFELVNYGGSLAERMRPTGLHLAGGPGTHPAAHPQGHVVVMRDGLLEWDPHPEGRGLVSIEWWYLLIPLAGDART